MRTAERLHVRDERNVLDLVAPVAAEEKSGGERRRRLLRRAAGYALALAMTGASALLRWVLPDALGPAPYLGFYPAVVVSAALGGVGPGVAAALASLLLVNVVFGRPSVDPAAITRQVIWIVASVGVSLLAGMQRAARLRERRTEAALRDSEEQLRLAALASGIGVWSWIPGTSEVSVGAKWRQLFGVAPDAEITFETWRDALHPDDRDRAVRELNAASEAHREFDAEYRVVRPDGSVRWIADRGRAYYDADGRPVRMGGVNVDITELKNAEEALREADRRKDEFLGMLSHELRNPLAPLRNSIFILRRPDASGEQARRAQDVIERQTEHLTRLVDDLLDVTRIANGKVQLRRARVDLREIVRRASDDFAHAMSAKGIAFRTAVPEAGVWADADPTRIAQVIGNLLHNAAKFARRGDEVTLSLATAGRDAQIRVRDTGPGIEPALLPRIFEPFFQGERTLARTEGGLGLGLALVRGITELHGGSVHAASEGRGQGALFLVKLPLAEPAAAQEAPRPVAGAQGKARRVLVVDDSADAAETLAEIVELLGHEAEIAYDGPTAIDRARANPPQVLLCDIGLPGMDGYEVARRIRAACGAAVQLVAITGYAQPEDVKKALDAGFDAHLAKPPDLREIERLLS